jgi:hypothetical protein
MQPPSLLRAFRDSIRILCESVFPSAALDDRSGDTAAAPDGIESDTTG